jgi:Meiotically Up-regulated Gene 113 (MUG113) protein
MVGKEEVTDTNDIKYLRESTGVIGPLARKDNFKDGPHRYTYFILGSEGIKIGQSFNPRSRRTDLQPGSATELKLLLAVPYERIPEPEAHKKFKHLRMMGEWFRPEQDLLDFIEELRAEFKPYAGPRIRKGSTEIEKTVTGLLKQRRSASGIKKNLIHNMVQQLRNYSAEEDPIAKANLERMIAYTAGKIEKAA